MQNIRQGDIIFVADTKELDLPLSREKIEELGWKILQYEKKDPPYQVEWIYAEKGKGYERYHFCINLAMPPKWLTVWKHSTRIYVGRCSSLREYFIIKDLIDLP